MSGLSWLQMAESDDFLTRNLVDNLFFWIETRKIKKGYQTQLKIDRRIILKLLQKYMLSTEKPRLDKCISQFMRFPAVQTFISRYQNDEQTIAEFKKHAGKYIEMYSPDCGFELVTTDRYELKSGVLETSVVAKKEYNAGDEIKYLYGAFAELKPEEEELLDKSDFSVINLTSRQYPCLMLGPSRFVNHDCDANARFSSNRTGLKIIAVKNILVGEEITVTYAKSYFGKDNKDCLCATCERLCKGYYDPDKYVIPKDAELIDISSTDEESSNEMEHEIIVVDSESDQEKEALHESTPAQDDEVSSISPIPVDPQEFSKTNGSLNGKKVVPSIVSSIHLATDEPFVEPESEAVGGRRLRPREKIKRASSYKNQHDILRMYPRDKSLDSLLFEIPNLNREVLKQRQINRTMHKLLMTQLYKVEDRSNIYDCRHCGTYFKLLPEAQHQYQKYCPRCARHQLIFGLAWPETKKKPNSGYLVLDDNIVRPPLSKVEKLAPKDIQPKKIQPKKKAATHGGIASARSSTSNAVTENQNNINNKNNSDNINNTNKKKSRNNAHNRKSNIPDHNSDFFTESSDSAGNSTPEVLPLGSNSAGKGGIKRVTGLRKMRVKLSEIYDSRDNKSNGTNGKQKMRVLQVENQEKVQEARSGKGNSSRKFNISTEIKEVRKNRFEKDSSRSRSRDSTPTKEEILASHPKINPTELAKSVNERKALKSKSANGKLSPSKRENSEIEKISEHKFADVKAKRERTIKTEHNKKAKEPKFVIPENATIVTISSESDEPTPLKPFKNISSTMKREKLSPDSSPNKKQKTNGSGIHKVSLPTRVKQQDSNLLKKDIKIEKKSNGSMLIDLSE